MVMNFCKCRKPGRVGVDGIANCYGLVGPEVESRWGRDFQHLSKPALGPLPSQATYTIGNGSLSLG